MCHSVGIVPPVKTSSHEYTQAELPAITKALVAHQEELARTSQDKRLLLTKLIAKQHADLATYEKFIEHKKQELDAQFASVAWACKVN